MANRIPANAYNEYLAMGAERSYQALADRYGVSKVAIYKRAKREGWQDRIAKLETKAREKVEEKTVDKMQEVRERHLREARFLQARALQALKDLPPEKGVRAASALNVAWKHELLLLGEPTERQANVEEITKREMARWLVVEDEDGNGTPLRNPE